MTSPTGITFDQVEKVASEMLTQGVKPTVRGVMAVTGGKTETVSGFLRDFFDKRDGQLAKMADELGSGDIAKLLAGEMQLVVDRKTASLTDTLLRQKAQITELIELLEEKERDCNHQVDLAESKSLQATSDAQGRIKQADARADKAAADKAAAETDSAQVQQEAQQRITAAEQRAAILVEAAQAEAASLTGAANQRADKAELEAKSLREQVQALSIDQAKREIETAQFAQAQAQLATLRESSADQKTHIVRLETEKNSNVQSIGRLDADLKEARSQSVNLGVTQTELIGAQKHVSQLQHDLAQSERERESLSRALAAQG